MISTSGDELSYLHNNVLGIALLHALWRKWLLQEKNATIYQVFTFFKLALFTPLHMFQVLTIAELKKC